MASSAESDIPTPWADKEWLESVLRDAEEDPSLSITDYHFQDINLKGDHYMSEMHRISIQVQRADSKESKMALIGKKFPPGKELRKTLSEASLFPNEITVYSQMLPKFQDILDSAAPGKFKPFSPRHIYSQNKFPHFLIVTDLSPDGFKTAKRQHGLDLDHCLLVMRELGRFHAASIALHDRDPQLVESVKENVLTEESSVDLMNGFAKPNILSLAKVVRSWPDGGERIANKLINEAETFCEKVRQQVLSAGNRLNVLAHGDLCLNNFLFKYNDATGCVEDIRFIDFQQACYTSCAIDLQFFIHSSPKDEVRAAHTEDILREYHTELCSTLELLGLTRKAITFQELLEEYERKGVYGFLLSLEALPAFLADADDTVDIENVLAGGNATKSSDTRASNKELVKVMKRLLPLFEQKGYF